LPARIFPAELPSFIRQDPLREAECVVYDLLRAQLDSSFTAYYSRYWFGLTPDGAEKDGEADFIIVHPTFGLLTLEVKGGGISYDPASSTWQTINRWKIRSHIKDPFQQTRTCKHRLLDELRNNSSTAHLFIRARHAVIFPDSESTTERLGWDKSGQLICFSNNLKNLGTFIRGRMGSQTPLTGKEVALGEAGVAFFDNLLAKKFTLQLSLGRVLEQDESSFVVLSDQQFQIMEGFAEFEKLAIAGPAGSGKTILAVEQARRSARDGKVPVLFCCFNSPLATSIRRKLSDTKVEVRTIHRLLSEFGTSTSDNEARTYIESVKRYRVIIVDEGQDFEPAWWPILESILEQDGQLFVFYDDRQKLYERPSNYIKGMPKFPFTLSRNLRNTKQVFRVARPWITGAPPVSSWGPDGPDVLPIPYDGDGLRNALCNALRELIEIQRIEPRAITVLCCDPGTVQRLRQGNKICKLSAHDAEALGEPGITIDTVRRFKGLESRVVVLAIAEGTIPEHELLYVGLTRARSYLLIVGRPDILKALVVSEELSTSTTLSS
jgi:hypothetical protein